MPACTLGRELPLPWRDGSPVLDPLPIVLDLITLTARHADPAMPRRSAVRALFESAIRCVLKAESPRALRALARHHHRLGANYLGAKALHGPAVQRFASAHFAIARVIRDHLERQGDSAHTPVSPDPDNSHDT